MRILVIDDDADMAHVLNWGLSRAGYEVEIACSGEEGIIRGLDRRYEHILLDLLLPGIGGREVLCSLRAAGIDARILLLSAIDDVMTKVELLDLGADDYITKPFNFEELLARIGASGRRSHHDTADQLHAADVVLDRRRHRVVRGGRVINVTPREFDLLEFLMLHKNETVTRASIANHVWKYKFNAESNVVDVYVAYLRRKIDAGGIPSLIQSVRGCGYMIADP